MILQGSACRIPLRDESVNAVITSPPYYGLRSYLGTGDPLKGHELGLEPTPDAYVANLVSVFREVRRVCRPDATVWLVIGDSYSGNSTGGFRPGAGRADGVVDNRNQRNRNGNGCPDGLKPKDLIGIPWRAAFALQADGWWLRSDIIWAKNNPMPESVTDRPTRSHEYIFLLTKSARYWYDAVAIAEASTYPGDNRALRTDTRKAVDPMCADNGSRARTGNPTGPTRNARSVWTIATQPTPLAHFATYPQELAKRCILAGCPSGGVVLDPFSGSGTTVYVAHGCGRRGIGLDLSAAYCRMARERNGLL